MRRKDEKEFGEYRTKRVILEMYDAMAQAMESGTVYVTRLVPEAASGLVAHSAEMGVKKRLRGTGNHITIRTWAIRRAGRSQRVINPYTRATTRVRPYYTRRARSHSEQWRAWE